MYDKKRKEEKRSAEKHGTEVRLTFVELERIRIIDYYVNL